MNFVQLILKVLSLKSENKGFMKQKLKYRVFFFPNNLTTQVLYKYS